MLNMFGADIVVYIGGLLVTILGFLGVYAKGQHNKIKTLKLEKKQIEAVATAQAKRAETNRAKAELHKEVAREVIKNNEISKEKVKTIQEKIDAVKSGEEITISI
jgi:predicted LPLAT superfamily acyltransferase